MFAFCNVEISVLMETIGQKGLSCLIVPHCLDPQALCPDGVHFFCGFLTTACGFPPGEHVCQSTRTWAQCLSVSSCPSPGSSFALGVGLVTIHLCPCLHVFFIFVP